MRAAHPLSDSSAGSRAEQRGNTRVFYLKYASATKVVPVLTGIGEQLKDKAGAKAKTAPRQAI
jgi:hypothetical protein